MRLLLVKNSCSTTCKRLLDDSNDRLRPGSDCGGELRSSVGFVAMLLMSMWMSRSIGCCCCSSCSSSWDNVASNGINDAVCWMGDDGSDNGELNGGDCRCGVDIVLCVVGELLALSVVGPKLGSCCGCFVGGAVKLTTKRKGNVMS